MMPRGLPHAAVAAKPDGAIRDRLGSGVSRPDIRGRLPQCGSKITSKSRRGGSGNTVTLTVRKLTDFENHDRFVFKANVEFVLN